MHTQQPVLNEKELHDLHAWWQASNYLAAGQLYLLDNPLLQYIREFGVDLPEVRNWKWTQG